MARDRDNSAREDIHSKVIRAGKRTYFFDVKSTRGNDLYLTITESKKRFHEDGKHSYEKHKLFLYKEDFEKFADGLYETIEKIKDIRSGDNEFIDPTDQIEEEEVATELDGAPHSVEEFTDISFDDLNRDGLRD